MRGRHFRYFFDSTAKTLVIYREFWYFPRIFPTLFPQLIRIFMILLHTFSMGVKTDARLPRSERFASIMRSGVLLRPPVSAGVLGPLKKWAEPLSCKRSTNSNVTHPFCNGSNTPARVAGGGKNANRSLLGSRASVFTMYGAHEYANELGKQGGKKPRKILKFSVNHERFSRTIEKNI